MNPAGGRSARCNGIRRSVGATTRVVFGHNDNEFDVSYIENQSRERARCRKESAVCVLDFKRRRPRLEQVQAH